MRRFRLSVNVLGSALVSYAVGRLATAAPPGAASTAAVGLTVLAGVVLNLAGLVQCPQDRGRRY